ncbi:urease accessory protein UreD [Saccharopolyspora griseoalba]|uniref:Urease accessory protein UreD n=1 Tax=Saccharopolyspora griseoalba TaxID=1431848 RepID=A0ABW2LJE6_9PSEU
MRARASLSVELARGRSVVRELRSQAPLTLLPRRASTAPDGTAVVHLVGSAANPLGGDEVELDVRVGAGARLRLVGTAATVALPGRGSSRSVVRIEVAEGGTAEYLPEAAVISERADHRAELSVRLGAGARARCRETLVLGRSGEPPGRLVTGTQLVRGETPLLRQRLDLGDPRLTASSGYLAGARVLATEVLAWDEDPPAASSGRWWSLSPLAAGGCLATAVADDAVTAARRLAEAVGRHPGAAELGDPMW